MPKLITFKAPCLDKKSGRVTHEERKGYIAKLYVGNVQEKFVLQVCNTTGEVEYLTHYASGNRVGALNPIKIRHMCRAGNYSRFSDRDAAKELLADVVSQHGADHVRQIMNKAPVLNT